MIKLLLFPSLHILIQATNEKPNSSYICKLIYNAVTSLLNLYSYRTSVFIPRAVSETDTKPPPLFIYVFNIIALNNTSFSSILVP